MNTWQEYFVVVSTINKREQTLAIYLDLETALDDMLRIRAAVIVKINGIKITKEIRNNPLKIRYNNCFIIYKLQNSCCPY